MSSMVCYITVYVCSWNYYFNISIRRSQPSKVNRTAKHYATFSPNVHTYIPVVYFSAFYPFAWISKQMHFKWNWTAQWNTSEQSLTN